MSSETRKLTFGEIEVGLSFNPSKNPLVDKLKQTSALLIDICHDLESTPHYDAERYIGWLKDAIKDARTACMTAVKAVTYEPEAHTVIDTKVV
jgi:hypothetical protein